MKNTLQETLNEIKGLVRAGQLLPARRRLKAIHSRRISPEDRLALAELARAVGDPLKSIQLLNPAVRSTSKKKAKPTPHEETLYAASLIRIGAVPEALEILKRQDPKIVPRSLLFQSHALFTQWQYQDAIPLLQKYVSLEKDEHQLIIGKVNLAAALVQEKRHEQSEAILKELPSATRRLGLSNFEGNTLEILAQQEIQRKDWKSARATLDEAHELLRSAGGLDEFFVRKWKAVVELLTHPKSARAVSNLTAIREEARQKKHWETIRECDRFVARAMENEALFLKVYFGTPFPSYREKILAEFPKQIALPEAYQWQFGENAPTRVLRLLRGESVARGHSLKVGQLKHRLLRTLVSDFYRPARVATVFASLYPDELYDPSGSASRVHQAEKELRAWFRSTNVPLSIKEDIGSYQIAPTTKSSAIEIPGFDWWLKNPHRLGELRAIVLKMNFSASQVSQRLGLPRRSAFQLLQQGMEMGLIIQLGSGPATRYRFK